jgi:kinesin family protein 1
MLGYGPNRGIIPMVCDNIFDKIKKDTDKTHSYEVKVSMMEIYNETLRDLLTKSKKHQELKIC